MDFEILDVYRLAEKLGNQIWNVVIHWSNFERDSLGKQLIR